jgi:hypothetical protein
MLISSKATTKRCSERVGSNEDLHPTHFTIVSCRQKMAEQVFQYSTPLWQRGLILARRRRQWPLKLARTIRSTKSYQNPALQGNIYLVASFNLSLYIRKEFRPFISEYKPSNPCLSEIIFQPAKDLE